MKKEYLADGVYVEIERGMLKVTTEDGIHVLNTIYLDPVAYGALVCYARRAETEGKTGDIS